MRLEELKVKTGLLLNNRVDDEFYDFYMIKGNEWLLNNQERIENDYNNNIEKMKFDIILNTKLEDRNELIDNLVNNDIQEFSKYIDYVPYLILDKKEKKEIENKFNYFKTLNKQERVIYFDTICR